MKGMSNQFKTEDRRTYTLEMRVKTAGSALRVYTARVIWPRVDEDTPQSWSIFDRDSVVEAESGPFDDLDQACGRAFKSLVKLVSARPAASPGYTLVEILVVVAIVGVIVAALMPALAGARRAAYRAAQQSEFEVMAQALAAFRAERGDHPPSAVILDERGDYSPAHLSVLTPVERALAQRSLAALGRLYPRVRLSTAGPVPAMAIPGGFYDFNGNGQADAAPVVLTGDECLVFFLSGDGRLPTNPWRPGEDRTRRYAFRPGSLVDPDDDGFPSCADQLTGRVIAYFAAVAPGQYDPRDMDDTGEPGAAFTLPSGDLTSYGPNPYSDGPPKRQDRPARWHRAESFQLISAGHDGRFGPGGQWSASESGPPLPGDGREEEQDNLSNFKRGTLGE